MNHKTVNLLDLPDEILLMIMKKLGPRDVLYSLLGVNKRLDQMARSIDNTTCIDFVIASSNMLSHTPRHFKLDRFRNEILPRIHHNVVEFRLDCFSMKDILLACKYPNLRRIVIDDFLALGSLRDLSGESTISGLFRNQLTHITVVIRKVTFSRIFFTNACAGILAMYTKLSYLNINQAVKSHRTNLSFYGQPRNFFCSSHLRTLIFDAECFDDCLYLLGGRFDQLSSFTVNIRSIEKSSILVEDQRILSNLKEFSLICYTPTDAYDNKILPLLHRMSNLNSLTLNLHIKRSKVIDGIHLNENILDHMLHLNTFIFHICAIMLTSKTNLFLSTNDIQNTFINWKYSPVNCCLDHYIDGYNICHIYSTPFEMNRFIFLTNRFRGHDHLENVIDLTLYDARPFKHDFFQWISRAFPLLKYLKINNLTSQKNKYEIESFNDKQISSKISYLCLIKLQLFHAHIDYADQFLRHKNAYVPRLHTLAIQYHKLVTVTNNFTNDATRFNCAQLKQLIFGKLLVYPEHFYPYFPSLIEETR